MSSNALAAPAASSHSERSLDPVFVSYCKHLRRRNLRPRTVESYTNCLAVYADWLCRHCNPQTCRNDGVASEPRNPLTVTAADLETFRGWLVNEYRSPQGRRVGLGRQAYYVAVLRGFYRWAERQRLISSNPASELVYPTQPRRLPRSIPAPAEVKRLIQRPSDSLPGVGVRDQLALRLLVLSGLRASEAVGLNLDDVNLADRELRIEGKGGKHRLMFFDITTQAVLARYLSSARQCLTNRLDGACLQDQSQESGLLVNDRGGRLNRDQLLGIVRHYARACGLGQAVTCHTLRHTFCTLMLRSGVAGMNLRVISELAGHTKLGTTARYTHVDLQTLGHVYQQAHPRDAKSFGRLKTLGSKVAGGAQ